MKKTEAAIKESINTTPDKLWEIVADFGALDTFVEGIESCEIEGSGTGAVRTLTLQDGTIVKEKLISRDDTQRKLTYSILESPMPIKNYTGTMQVEESDNQTSVFTWSSTFETGETAEEDMIQALEGLYAMGAEGLRKKLE